MVKKWSSVQQKLHISGSRGINLNEILHDLFDPSSLFIEKKFFGKASFNNQNHLFKKDDNQKTALIVYFMLQIRKILFLKFCVFTDIFNAVLNSVQSIFQYQWLHFVFDNYLKHSVKGSDPRRGNKQDGIKFSLTSTNGKISGMLNEQNKSAALFFKTFPTQ